MLPQFDMLGLFFIGLLMGAYAGLLIAALLFVADDNRDNKK